MPAVDNRFSTTNPSVPPPGRNDPAYRMFAITPHDTNEVACITRGLYLGTSGDVSLILEGDTVAVTLVGLAGGVIHPLTVRKVLATGTTAASIVGVY